VSFQIRIVELHSGIGGHLGIGNYAVVLRHQTTAAIPEIAFHPILAHLDEA